jgi:hypothetical protein
MTTPRAARANRARNATFQRIVSLFLRSKGIENVPRPYHVRQSQRPFLDLTPGHIQGVPNVLINTRCAENYQPTEQVRRARAEAEEGDLIFYFSVIRSHGLTDPADALVVTDLRTLAAILPHLPQATA